MHRLLPFSAFLVTVSVLSAGCRSSQVWFSADSELTTVLTDHIATAAQTLDVAVYTFTSEPIRDAIIDAAARGVETRVVIDGWEANDPIANGIADAGVPMRRAFGFNGGIMHHKFAVVDGQSVATGSFNYTYSADNENDENLVIISDKALAGQYTNAFDELWRRAE